MPKSFRSIPPLTEDLYGGLTPTEAARLVDAGVRAFAEGNHDMAEGIARWLVCLTVCIVLFVQECGHATCVRVQDATTSTMRSEGFN